MLTPGAVMSGFNALSADRGPRELKVANFANPALVRSMGVTVAATPFAASSLPPCEAEFDTPRNGIVTVNGMWVSGLDVIGPSNGGSPAALFTMTTAAAPACWPKIAFATRAQLPRLTTAIVFGGSELGPPKAATLQPSDSSAESVPPGPSGSTVVAGSSTITLTVYVDDGGSAKPFALMAVRSPLGIWICAPGVEGVESVAAVAIAPAATPGEPAT